MVVQARMTASEFLALPESNLPVELLDGEIIMSPAPELSHQDIVLQLAILIKQAAKGGKTYVAPVDVYLDESNVVQPDVLWIADGSACVPVEGKYLRGAPEFVAEVFSPGTARRDKKDKFRLYEKFGVREYWMIDPGERLLEVWQLKKGHFALLDVFGPGEQFASLLGAVETGTIFPE
jgi:Uma2 family endonuclease